MIMPNGHFIVMESPLIANGAEIFRGQLREKYQICAKSGGFSVTYKFLSRIVSPKAHMPE
jgi:hypothetical protein